MVPRLHVVTDDAILRRPRFIDSAREVLHAGAGWLGLHLRGHGVSGRELFAIASALLQGARDAGARLVINDRVDAAIAAGVQGIHLGVRSIPPGAARRLLPGASIGYSAHAPDEASGVDPATDYVFLGTIYETASHPDRPALGTSVLRRTCAGAAVPVIAIGGVTPDRIGEVIAAGAHGIAVLGGVWNATDPVAAMRVHVDALRGASVTA
jgi:thiamine-phosphate diphosphorylase